MWDTFRKYITSNITGKVLCIQTSSAKISTKGPTNHIWKLLLTIQCLLWSMWLKKPASSPVRRWSSKSRSRQSTPRRNYDQKLANRPNCSKTAQYNLLYTCQPLQANNSTYWQWGEKNPIVKSLLIFPLPDKCVARSTKIILSFQLKKWIKW